jgi:hypothetical protein
MPKVSKVLLHDDFRLVNTPFTPSQTLNYINLSFRSIKPLNIKDIIHIHA